MPMELSHEYLLQLGGNQLLLRIDRPELTRNQWGGMGHNHAVYELHLLLEGSCPVDVEGKSYLLQAGQAILIAPGKYHCPMPAMGQFDRFSLCFSVENGALADALTAVEPCRIYPVTAEIMNLCRDIFYEFSQDRLFGEEVLRCHLLRLLVCHFRLLNLPLTADGLRARSPILGRADYNDLIDLYFETHLKDGANAAELAKQLHVSPRHLSRLLKSAYGMNFREKLIRTRMVQAAWFLRHTDMTVSAVANEVGYTVPSSFYHVFRQYYGTTPEGYRAQQHHQEVSP